MAAVTVQIKGMNELLRATKGDLSSQMRKKSRAIAQPIAEEAQSLARRGTPTMRALAPAIRAKSDRVPTVMAGTARRLTSSRQPNNRFFLGAEFGDGTKGKYKQFGRPIGGGQSVYPAVWANRDNTARQWLDAVEEVWTS